MKLLLQSFQIKFKPSMIPWKLCKKVEAVLCLLNKEQLINSPSELELTYTQSSIGNYKFKLVLTSIMLSPV